MNYEEILTWDERIVLLEYRRAKEDGIEAITLPICREVDIRACTEELKKYKK